MKHIRNYHLRIERWRDVTGFEGFEGLYQASTTGKVMNKKTGKILKPYKVGGGYFEVRLCNNYNSKQVYVHRLVTQVFPELIEIKEQFKDIPFSALELNHKDEHKENNCVWNLEWCDRLYNVNYGNRNTNASKSISKAMTGKKLTEAHKQSISKAMTGIKSNRETKPVQQISLDGILIKEWSGMFEASKQLNIPCASIYYCCNGRYHTAGGYKWQYT